MRALLLTLTTCLFVLPASAKYSGGTGEPNDPYQIATAADMIALGETPEDYNKHFVVTADIDLDPNLPGRKVFDKAVIAPDMNDTQDDFQGIPFRGLFDGDGHTISHLTIQGMSYLGLFGQVGSWDVFGGEVKNLGLADVHITGSGATIGGLVGGNYYASVTRCSSTGAVSGNRLVGGLVGCTFHVGNVILCYSSASVHGEEKVGGLVGGLYRPGQSFGAPWVFQCSSTGSVGGTGECIGGLVGYIMDGGVRECYSSGAVRGTRHVGGLVGLSLSGGIADSYAKGSATGQSSVGGLVGTNSNWGGADSPGEILSCYATGPVEGADSVGGLVGTQDPPAHVDVSFWDTETSGQTTSAGGTGETTAEMQTAKTFLDAGWDFVGETVNGSEDIWKISEGLGYSRLSWEKYSGGTGEPSDPYQIATAEDLIALGQTPADYGKHFILTADIDLDPNVPGGKVFDRAVIGPALDPFCPWPSGGGIAFMGVFDGDGHTISHLIIVGGCGYGPFGWLGSTGEIKNLTIADVSITGGEAVGGLVSWNSGTIADCHVRGLVLGDRHCAGGLVAWNQPNATITCCSFCGNVGWMYGGSGRRGGLVGQNEGEISFCHSAGSVSWAAWSGGLVGLNLGGVIRNCYSTSSAGGGLVGTMEGGTVSNCYSIGAVSGWLAVGGLVGSNQPYFKGTVTDCFWDTQTSGQTTSDGGVGLPTAEMQMASTFLDYGWDFVDETGNGTEDIWWINEGQDYPRLWWEIGGGTSP